MTKDKTVHNNQKKNSWSYNIIYSVLHVAMYQITMIGIVMNYNDLTVHRYTFATGIRSVLHVIASDRTFENRA